MTEKPQRPYAAQLWAPGVLTSNVMPGSILQIISQDLDDDIRAQGLAAEPYPIQLWHKESDGTKGFFVGNTSSLPDEGWTKLATL